MHRQTRGSSRGRINYIDNLKNSAPYYGSSIKKPTYSYNETGIMKNGSKPSYESALKNSVKDTGSRMYSYVPTSNYGV